MRHSPGKPVTFFLLWLSVVAAAQDQLPATSPRSTETSPPTVDLDVSNLPKELFPLCPTPTFTPVNEDPDKIAQLFNPHKRYRLVIGVGEFKDDPAMNRTFVKPTADLIDARLAKAGYEPLPNVLATEHSPNLTGCHATKDAIKHAVLEMANKLQEGDFGIIYYIGHGSNAPSHLDLTLSVYDRPVADDEGIRVSDIVGVLGVSHKVSNVKEIPHYIIVLETCYSGGAVANQEKWEIQTRNDLQTWNRVLGQEYPSNFALISATAPGLDSTRAYDLHGANLSAFGVFFLRALNEDWECADTNQDGILTLDELTIYVGDRLDFAFRMKPPLVDGLMLPQATSREAVNFLAYSAARHVTDGDRKKIGRLWVEAKSNQSVTLTVPSGYSYLCTSSQPCSVPISMTEEGKVQISSQPISDPFPDSGYLARLTHKLGVNRLLFGACKSCDAVSEHLYEYTTISALTAKHKQTVGGATVQLK